MRVNVDKAHIANGTAKNSQHCMIADAIKATCPKAQFIMVDLQTIRFSDPVKRQRYVFLTPAVAQHNILKFDKGDTVKPFSFSLAKPVRAHAMQAKRRGDPVKAKATVQRARAKYEKRRKSRDYAYLAANRARNHQKEREFGLRKFVE